MTDVIGKTPSARIAAGAMVAVDVEVPVAVGVGVEAPVGVSLGASVIALAESEFPRNDAASTVLTGRDDGIRSEAATSSNIIAVSTGREVDMAILLQKG